MGTPDALTTPAPPPAAPPAPDWSTIPDEITCPLCGYNLRGLTDPRCPECGYTFSWPDLIDPQRRTHPYLFEHHPRRNLWSFVRTFWGSTRPRHFWQTLHPRQPGNVRRLVIYWLITQAAVLLLGVGTFAKSAVELHRRSIALRSMNAGWVAQWRLNLDEYAPLAPSWTFIEGACQLAADELKSHERGVWLLAFLAWPWLSYAALSLFQISMLRARVHQVHVLRCVLYTADATAWYYAAVAAAFAASAFRKDDWLGQPPWSHYVLPVATALLALVFVYRLSIAYRLYLRFHRPFLTVLASQVIVVLATLLIAVWTGLLY